MIRAQCPACGQPSKRPTLDRLGCCARCYASDGELTGEARELAIKRFMAWLGDRMPSEAVAQEQARLITAVHMYMQSHGRRHLLAGRSGLGRRREAI